MVAENPELAEASECCLESQMGPPKNLRKKIPLTGAKLKSVVEVVPQGSVDQPDADEVVVPLPLQPTIPTSFDVVVEDVTHEDPISPNLGDLPPPSAPDQSAPEDREKTVIDLDPEMDASAQEVGAGVAQAAVLAVTEDADTPVRPFERPRQSLGSTSTSALERLMNADPCANVPLKRVPRDVRDFMAMLLGQKIGRFLLLTRNPR